MSRFPVVALCLGDPAGIGPEIAARALADPSIHERASVVAVGDPGVLERARNLVNARARIVPTAEPRAMRSDAATWPLVEVPLSGRVHDGVVSASGGRAAGEAIERAAALALEGLVDAVAAAPSNKQALHLGGYRFDDHTAMLGHLTGTAHPLLMPVSGDLRLVSITNHLPMAATCAAMSSDLVLRTIRGMSATLRQMGIPSPRLGVAALNPHAGEGGDFGDDEIVHIAPAVAAAQSEGIDARGPYPADSLFTPDKRRQFDGFVTMYHDQGRIAQKTLSFGKIVTITAGLPFFFATVGHGSAFDIAWQGRADAGNMVETLRTAVQAAEAASAAP